MSRPRPTRQLLRLPRAVGARRARTLVGALLAGLLVLAPATVLPARAALAPVGQGFTVTTGDLAYILRQIKIAERHAMTRTPANPCGTLLAQPGDGIPDAEQVPDPP